MDYYDFTNQPISLTLCALGPLDEYSEKKISKNVQIWPFICQAAIYCCDIYEYRVYQTSYGVKVFELKVNSLGERKKCVVAVNEPCNLPGIDTFLHEKRLLPIPLSKIFDP